MQTYAVAGATHMDGFSFNMSQLDRIIRRLCTGLRALLNLLESQP
jgi:hypothetical protein